MERESFWSIGEQTPCPTLRGRRTSDAVVIGGGLSGLTIALWLCKAGLRVSLLEAARLGGGASRACGGIVSLSGGLLYARMEKQRGAGAVEMYARTRQSAFDAIKALCIGADADWQDADARIVTDVGESRLEAEAEAMKRAGIAASVTLPTQCPLPSKSALLLRDMGVLNPAKYMDSLRSQAEALGLQIYENSRVIAVETNLAYTEHGSVLAPYLIVATGYPIVNVPGWYFLRLVQRRGGLARLTGSAPFEGVYVDADGRFALRRIRENTLLQINGGLVGGDANATIGDVYQARYAQYLEGKRPIDVISGIETFTPDGLPYIGAYSKKTPNLFVACGYAGQGLLGSMTAAQAVSAAILGLPADAFAICAGSRGLGGTGARAALALGGRYLKSQLSFRAPRCPHMGCKLKYRRSARVWECPCHGSRFDDIGHVLNAPATRDADIDRR